MFLLQAFESLDLERGNYEEVATLILSHNKLTRLDSKILSLRPERGLKVDHNLLTGITWDLSLLLQSFQVRPLGTCHVTVITSLLSG